MGVCCGIQKISRQPSRGNPIPQSNIFDHVITSNIHRKYEFIRVIDHGQFGTVREAVSKASFRPGELGNKFAIKSILKRKVKNKLEILKKQIEIMIILDHPNIVRLYETYQDDKYLHLVLELCTGGDLLDYMKRNQNLSQSKISQIVKKLMVAVNYLHNNQICHRDLKPENILFASQQNGGQLKIIDFGVSQKYGEEKRMNTLIGTPCYIAPQVIVGDYSNDCDIWSIGIIMYFMLSGTHPFKSFDINDLFEQIQEGRFSFPEKYFKNVSKEAKNLIQSLLIVNPRRRMSIKLALTHPWFHLYKSEAKGEVSQEILGRLQKFSSSGQLWQETMKILVKNLSGRNIKGLQNAFLAIDRDNTGTISVKELATAMEEQNIGLGNQQLIDIINKLAGTGKQIHYSDFIVATMDKKELLNQEVIWNAFRFFDTNSDGVISKKEILMAFERAGCVLNQMELEVLIDESGVRIDDGLTYQMFLNMLQYFHEEEDVKEVSPNEYDFNKMISLRYSPGNK